MTIEDKSANIKEAGAHNSWQLLPELTQQEYESLKADIAANGVRVPIVKDQATGATIDGHHRIRAVEELRAEGMHIRELVEVRTFADDDERVGFVVSANLFRRHLTREQRAEVVSTLRDRGWSLRRIGEALGVNHTTVRNDISGVENPTPATILPSSIVVGKDGKNYKPTRPHLSPSIIVSSPRDETRARAALTTLGSDAPAKLLSLKAAEERARDAHMAQLRTVNVPARIEGPAYELRLGDLREVWADVPDGSIDGIVTDPPYDIAGVPFYRDLAILAARVLKPGRIAAVYCGHLQLDEEMALLVAGGLRYVWHGVNFLPGQHTRVHTRQINGRHRSVLLYSAGEFAPRKWIHDAFLAVGSGGPETRQLHPWQQAVEPLQHWVRMISEPGELVFDPFVGSGTSGVAAVAEGRRFIGGDLDPACVEMTRQRLEEIARQPGEGDAS